MNLKIYQHSYCAQPVTSNIFLTELPFEKKSRASFFFRLRQPVNHLIELPWLHHWLSDEIQVTSYGRQDSWHWLQFPRLADFKISTDAKRIYCYPLINTPEETVRHLFLDQVLPRCMAHQNNLLLHASAVRTQKGIILFVGTSGAGKSTTAAYFQKTGDLVISDDCVLITEEAGQAIAIPSYGGIRLWEDSHEALFPEGENTSNVSHYSTKQRIFQTDSLIQNGKKSNILAVIFLSPPQMDLQDKQIILKSLTQKNGYIQLLKQVFLLDGTDYKKLGTIANLMKSKISTIKLFELSIPRDYNLLPKAREMILDAIAHEA